MLIILSDLHLTDGTRMPTLAPAAIELFAARLHEQALAASWRTSDRYQPVERIDLVLLGDILDLTRSAAWLESSARPWDAADRPELSAQVVAIASAVLDHNEPILRQLRTLAAPGQFTLPAADRHGRPVAGAGQNVDIAIHYLVGNHDWLLHLRGRDYDALREAIVRRMGLAAKGNAPLAHDPAEDPALAEALRRHRVIARHGDVFDPIHFAGDRAASSLGDALVIELIGRFSSRVEQELSDDLPVACSVALAGIDHVRPLLLVPQWLEGVLARTYHTPALRSRVARIWDNLVESLLALPPVRSFDARAANLPASLAELLRLGPRAAMAMQRLAGSQSASYAEHALTEPEFRSRRAKFVVYGHTHEAETVALEASHHDGYALNQLYFNTGTLRRAFRPARAGLANHEFIASEGMTWLAFYQGDERGGRPYESWSGTLGIAPGEVPMVRVDRPAKVDATVKPTVLPSPHFAAAPARPRVVPVHRR